MLYTVKPNALWGWDPETLVEIESPLDEAGRVMRVAVDRVFVGFVVKRSVTEWDYFLGKQKPGADQMVSFVFGSPSRLHAITTLVETVKARTERKYS